MSFGGGGGGGGGGGSPAPVPNQDNVTRMPVANSAAAIEAGRRKRREVMARQGRSSTRLAANVSPGITAYANNFLGGTN